MLQYHPKKKQTSLQDSFTSAGVGIQIRPPLPLTKSAVNDSSVAAADILCELATAPEPAPVDTFLEPAATDGLLEPAVE